MLAITVTVIITYSSNTSQVIKQIHVCFLSQEVWSPFSITVIESRLGNLSKVTCC